jgi:Fe-S-cluster containining protein
MEDYRKFLARADAWYRGVREKHPDRVTCAKGCRDCCLGLFDVTLLDGDLLREGLAAADPGVRGDIERRAEAILARLRETWPGLGTTLAGWTESEIDDLCDALGPVECPVLGPAGECRLYEHRPLTCRLSGVPVIDLSGERIYPEGCAKCTLSAAEAPRLDCQRLRRDERKILKKHHRGDEDVSLLIPQAVAPG